MKHLVFTLAAVGAFLLLSGCNVGTDTYVVFDGGHGDEDPCISIRCGVHGRCDSATSACVCNEGYLWTSAGCVPDVRKESCDGVDCSGHGTCFVIPDGRAVCDCETGYESHGIFCRQEIVVELPDAGLAMDAGSSPDVPTHVEDRWQSVVAHYGETYAIADDGSLWHWGLNNYDAFSNEPIRTPVRKGGDNDWALVNGGIADTCGIKTDGSLWCWGGNGEGQLGDGTKVDSLDPVPVGTDHAWRSVAIENIHTCAIAADGTLWGWGWNKMGQLGIGRFENKVYTAPQRGGGRDNWISVEVGVGQSCAIQSDGSGWCWGWNDQGQVGDGTTENRNLPVLVSADGPWLALSPGGWHTCGLKVDGSAWCWGSNNFSTLGDGSTVQYRITPAPVIHTGRFTVLDSGENATCAIGEDGTLWCWGAFDTRQMPEPLTPVRIGGDADWASISVGRGHACALKTDQTLWCWGDNSWGQIGNGAPADNGMAWESLPAKVVRMY